MELCGDRYWIHGNVGEYQFKAFMYHDYARIPKSELVGSKISKLSIQYQGSVVFDWERKMDVEAPNDAVQDLMVRLWSELPVLPHKPGDRIRLVAIFDDPDPLRTT